MFVPLPLATTAMATNVATCFAVESDDDDDDAIVTVTIDLGSDDNLETPVRPDSDTEACEHDFESVVASPSEVRDVSAALDTTPIPETSIPRLRRLRPLEFTTCDQGHCSDDACSPRAVAERANPQDPPALVLSEGEEESDEAEDDDIDMADDSDTEVTESSPSWHDAWNRPANDESIANTSAGGGDGGEWDVPPLSDPEIISVVFQHQMRVEMQFNPGLRHGAPRTRVLSSHWSFVHANF